MEALWKVDLDCGSTAAAGESRCVSPYSGDIVEGLFLQLPGDEPPSRNHTISIPPSSSDHRSLLPPVDYNCSEVSGGSRLFPVNHQYIRVCHPLSLNFIYVCVCMCYFLF